MGEEGEAVGVALAADEVWPGAAGAEAGLELIKFLQLVEEPCGVFAFGFGFEKFAPHMG